MVLCDPSRLQTRHTKTDVIASEAKQSKVTNTKAGLLRRLRFSQGRQLPTRKLVAAKPTGDLVQYGVHHPGLIAIDESMRDIDIFRHHDAAGHVLAILEFVGTRTQYR